MNFALTKLSVALVWDKTRNAVADLRVERGSERLAEYLQWLAEQQGASHVQSQRPAYLTSRHGRR